MPSVRLRLVASLALALGACGGAPERPGVPPRHVLLITIEGLRADHVSSLGYERRTTSLLRPDQPIVLDLGHVAQRGVSFAQAFALSAHPEPSVAALLGGGPPPGAEPPAPAGAAHTPGAGLAEDFAAAGLRTAAFVNGRSFEPSRRSAQGFGRGFAEASFHASDEEALAAAVAWLQAEVPAGEPHFTWIHLAGPTPPFAGPWNLSMPREERRSWTLFIAESRPRRISSVPSSCFSPTAGTRIAG